MSEVKQKYLKDENGSIFSPVTSIFSIYNENELPLNKFIEANIQYQYKTEGDFNDLVGNIALYPSHYFIDNVNLKNQPESSAGWLTSYYQSVNTAVQLYISNTANIFIRNKTSAKWNIWKKVTLV